MAREREFVSGSELALISYSFLPSSESRRRGSRAAAWLCGLLLSLLGQSWIYWEAVDGVENEASGLFFGIEGGLVSGRSESISLVILKVAPTPWAKCYPFLGLVSTA